MTDFFNSIGVDRDLLLVMLTILVIVLVVIVVMLFITTRKMFKRYDFFMRGKDAESLEDIVMDIRSKMYAVQDIEMEHRDRIKKLQSSINGAYNKTGVVKYNAFEGMGGHSSFAVAFLDTNNSGVILNAMHSRTSCYLYVKEVNNGEPDSALGAEEQEVLRIAMNK